MFGFIERFITLEKLQLSPKETKIMREFSTEQRLTIYNYLTGMAYKLNNDKDRMSVLRIRNLLMNDTKTKENTIDSDRVLTPTTMGSLLPDAMKDIE